MLIGKGQDSNSSIYIYSIRWLIKIFNPQTDIFAEKILSRSFANSFVFFRGTYAAAFRSVDSANCMVRCVQTGMSSTRMWSNWDAKHTAVIKLEGQAQGCDIYYIILYYIILYYIILYYIILYYIILYYIILYYIILYYIILYYIILYYIISYHIIQYYIILYYIILYYTILYYILLYYIISYHIILYYIKSYYIILY